MEVILLVGMPGSGKTHYGNELVKETGYLFLDDLKDKELFVAALKARKSVVVADPWLCLPDILDSALKISRVHTEAIQVIYWKNDLQQCLRNVETRNDGRKVDVMLKHLAKTYSPPESAREVWKV